MPFVDLVMLSLFACMAAVIVIDQRVFAVHPAAAVAPATPPREAPVHEPAEAPQPPLALPAGEELASLLPGAEGWTFVSPAGELLATNLPRRAALLSAACAALRLEAAAAEGTHRPLTPWTIARLEGPNGALLGEASGDGVLLAVLVRSGTDETRLREGMAAALAAVGEHVRGVGAGAVAVQILEAAAAEGQTGL